MVLLLVPRADRPRSAETPQASRAVDPEPAPQTSPQPEPMIEVEMATGPNDEAPEPVLASLAAGHG